ncbi:DUF262 domain-containing protein [Mycoplasma miroungirhinis]|uniref:DUF262 domain-containing protein n=1 Tax=Mycoplasma miroungirhinis TaxID=754516 RepID=A0A6M4JB87_9MOLU|nr:DUF262 domain-containing protein [Mycoplasma miroungirhinis]QJR44254.1 DUF262 domain-containing protein [Mycoplasma miroungirhinis]
MYEVAYKPINEQIEKYYTDKQKWLKQSRAQIDSFKYIDSSSMSVGKLFNTIIGIEGDDKRNGVIYQIPIFQRDYTWSLDLVLSLLENIESNSNKYIFLNTIIVTEKKDCNSDAKCHNLVDGQQRIFSLILIGLAIIKYKVSQNLPIDSNLINLMQKSNNSYKIEKYFKNAEKRADYETLIQFIKSKRQEDIKKEDVKKQNKIDKYLIALIKHIHNNTIKNPNYIDNLEQNLLHHTFINRVILSDVDENDVFLNLNKNSLPLNALDLFKSYIYSLAIDKCKLEDEKQIHDFISPLINEFKFFYIKDKNKNNILDEKLIYDFARKMSFHLSNNIDEKSELKTDAKIYLYLKNSLDYLIKINSINSNEISKYAIEKAFSNMIELFKEWQFISSGKYQIMCKYSFKKGENFNDSYLWHAVYGATYGFSLDIPTSIIWTLLEKYHQKGIFDGRRFFGKELEEKYKLVNELMQYLKEIEKAIILWKNFTFKGDSRTISAFKIASKINIESEDSYNSIQDFIQDLNLKIIGTTNSLSNEQIKGLFIKEVVDKEEDDEEIKEADALSEKLQTNNNLKTFYHMRYHFIEEIEKNPKILCNPISNISINGANNFDYKLSDIHYDHDMPIKLSTEYKEILKDNPKFYDESYEETVQLIGNGKLLWSLSNKTKSNFVPYIKHLTEKNKDLYSLRKFQNINDYIEEYDKWVEAVETESLKMCKTLYTYYKNKK